ATPNSTADIPRRSRTSAAKPPNGRRNAATPPAARRTANRRTSSAARRNTEHTRKRKCRRLQAISAPSAVWRTAILGRRLFTIRKLEQHEPREEVLSILLLFSFNNTLQRKLKVRRAKLSILAASAFIRCRPPPATARPRDCPAGAGARRCLRCHPLAC